MTQAQINRRRALAVVAAVPAAAALGGSAFTMGEPGELAALVRRYFAETEAFCSFARDRTDEECDAFAATTYEGTMERMVGIPAWTAEDALAALDWLIKDEANLGHLDTESREWHVGSRVAGSLVDAIREYIEGRAA